MAPTVEIAFADLLDVLSAVFQIPTSGRKALTSRLKHLQAKSFPPGVNVGRGGRVRYDIQAVMGTVLVLTLTSAFIPPNQAVEVVRRYWDKWRALLRGAANMQLNQTKWDLPGPNFFGVIESNVLADLGGASPNEGRAAGTGSALSFRVAGPDDISTSTGRERWVVTLIDVPTVLVKTAGPISVAALCEPADVFRALARQ